jgi:hypothetical protein
MFNVSRDNNWLGFSVGLPEEPPGFRIGEDGSPLPVLASRPTLPPLPSPPGNGIPPDMGELLLQTGGSIGPETMMGLQDRFAGNPYWPAERGQRRVSPIMPVGYGSPFAPAQLSLPEGVRTTRLLRSDPQVDVGEQDLPDAAVPSAGGLPGGIGSPQSQSWCSTRRRVLLHRFRHRGLGIRHKSIPRPGRSSFFPMDRRLRMPNHRPDL